ncbi:MAG: alpha/beta fold hydrolase [Vitreoscilla sp.]
MNVRLLVATAILLASGGALAQGTLPVPTLHTVDGRRVEILSGGTPRRLGTLVFENGLRETIATWDGVIKAVAPQARVFAYNRPGYGNSDDTPQPRDGATIVEELRRALKESGLAPPYVLVGHSLGGLYVQQFARAHPDEVAGVVLVDALYPGVVKRSEDFPFATRVAKRLFFSSAVNREIDQIHATGDAVLTLPPADAIPMIRLFNVPRSAGAVAVDFGVNDDDPAVRKRVEALYPNARKVIVDSDHRIQEANPELVVRAIEDVVAMAPVKDRLEASRR